MRRIKFLKGEVKSKRERLKERVTRSYSSDDIDVKFELIKSLIPVGLDYVNKLLQEGVERLAGKRYSRDTDSEYDRWAYQCGSIYLGGQKVPKTKEKQEVYKTKLQEAYEEPIYMSAKSRLINIGKELKIINESAYNSIEEGMEESLTPHKLGLFEHLGTSLKTTNCIESVMLQIGQKTDKVDCWRNSNQKHRWLAVSLILTIFN